MKRRLRLGRFALLLLLLGAEAWAEAGSRRLGRARTASRTTAQDTGFTDHRPTRDTVPTGKLLDMHVHVAGIGSQSGCYITPAIRRSFKFGMYLHAFDANEKDLIDSGDAVIFNRLVRRMRQTTRVGAAVVLALDGVVTNGRLDTTATQIYVPGDFVRRETLKRPGLLYGASVNPYRSHALQRLRQAALDGAVLVKWIPSIMLIDPADTSLIPFYREMVRLHLPLLSHTGDEHAFLRAADTLCDPRRLQLPLRLGVTVIAAHAGVPGSADGEKYSDMLMRLFPQYPNLYADISSLTQLNKLGSLKPLLADSVTRSRLLYGSDYPLNFTRLVAPLYHAYSIGFGAAHRLAAMPEHWDRDIALKEKLGLTPEVFLRSAEVLLPQPRSQLGSRPRTPPEARSRKQQQVKHPE